MNAKLKSVQPMHIVKIAMDSTYIWYINYPFPDVGKFCTLRIFWQSVFAVPNRSSQIAIE